MLKDFRKAPSQPGPAGGQLTPAPALALEALTPTPASIARCEKLDGDAILIDKRLSANRFEDMTVLGHGLYHPNGDLLKSSGVLRGNGTGLLRSVGGDEVCPRPALSREQRQPTNDYVWLGLFQVHFGHFLIGTLARLWAWRRYAHKSSKLVYVGDRDPAALFAIPHVAFCLGALNIGPHNLYRVGHGDHFHQIRAPDPAFIENHAAAPEFGEILAQIQARTELNTVRTKGLVYISKHKVRRGVRGFSNEEEFAEHMRCYGARILCPEELEIQQQIAFWCGFDGVATGFAGSAFHSAAFTTERRLYAISPHDWASSNQAMLDRLSGNITITAQTNGLLTIEPDVPEFQELLRIVDPKRMANLFMQFVEAHH